MSTNIFTVDVISVGKNSPDARIRKGIFLNIENPETLKPYGFSMEVEGNTFSWLNKMGKGVMVDGRLTYAGFYSRKKVHVRPGSDPYWRNIGEPFANGAPGDVEILLRIKPQCNWDIVTITGKTEESTWGKCLNFPNENTPSKEWLVRVPNGACIKIDTSSGSIMILNLHGELTSHPVGGIHSDLHDQAVDAAQARLAHCQKEYVTQGLFDESLEAAFPKA